MKNFVFDSIQICPYSSLYDDMSSNFPGIECFDDRFHFIYSDSIDYLALCMTVSNPSFGLPRRKLRKRTFIATILDTCTQEIIASTDFSICLSPWIAIDHPRIDMPIDISLFKPEREYHIEVMLYTARPIL